MLGGATAATILLPQCTSHFLSQTLSTNQNRLNSLFKSKNGLLKVALEAQAGRVQLAGKSANFLSYNGQIPGDRIEAKPGDTVQIQFKNSLSKSTNLHYHGLHIPPTENADNVFLKIRAGESFFYMSNRHPI